MTDAHKQQVTNRYQIFYPAHPERASDPHYKDFNAYRNRTKATAVCAFGAEVKDFSECTKQLELHHSHIEFAMENGVDLSHLEAVYPGVSNPDEVGAWVESAENLVWLCSFHHRAQAGGVHHVASADYEASHFIKGLLGETGT